jgi:hypothetical protein
MSALPSTQTRSDRLIPRLSASQVAAVGLLAFVFVFVSHQQVWHTDVWGHLRFGEYIVKNRRLPEHEMFSGDFADQEKPYLNFQWLAQASAYLVYELGASLAGGDAERQLAGGALALATEHAILVTLRLLVLLAVFRRQTGSDRMALLGILLVIGLGLSHMFVHRPQAFGELFFALLLLALSRPALTRGDMVWVPLVMVLWANCHGSFPMGFALLGAFAAGRAIELLLPQPLLDWPTVVVSPDHTPAPAPPNWLARWWHDPQLCRLILTLALSLAAVALFNPHGPKLFLYSYELSRHPNIPYMEEWKPLPVESMSGYLYLASVALLIPLVRWSPRRFTPIQVLLLLGFGLQSLAHARVLVWWSVVVVWVALPHLAALGKGTSAPSLRRRGGSLAKSALACLLVLAGLLLSAPGLWACAGYGHEPQKHVTDKTPWKVSTYLQQQYETDPRLKRTKKRTIFTSETLGDYLLWSLRLDPPVRVFCYTHVHLLTAEHWKECMAVKFGERGWEKILDRESVQFLLVEDIPLYQVLIEEVHAASERWKVELESPIFVARRKSAN